MYIERVKLDYTCTLFFSLHFILSPATLLSELDASFDVSQLDNMMLSIRKNGSRNLCMAFTWHLTLT